MRHLNFGAVILATLAIPFLSCGGSTPGTEVPGLGGASSGGGGQCGGDFGTSSAAQKLEAFLLATSKFTGTAAELQNSLLESCKRMGTELGVPDSEMQASGNTPAVKAACDAVAAKLRSEMQDLRASANLRIKIAATPPHCEVSMDAYAQCAGECDASVQPGQAEIQCEGGEISGKCTAECTGKCVAEVSGECSGQCEGTCGGSCTGKCMGNCDGQCSSRGADGQCNGKCTGTCHGTCTAGCTGSCQGECAVSGQASCSGECRGGCSIAYQEPRCSGRVTPPRMEAECKASCDARLNAEAQCEPGHATIAITGTVRDNVQSRVAKLRTAVESGFATVLAAKEKLERLKDAADGLGRTARDIPSAVGSLGLSAASCASEAASAVPRAAASVSVSVEVSVSVSGAASGSAG